MAEIVHFGHACVLVQSRASRILIDPGAFSALPNDLGKIDAVLITHAHFDHLSMELAAGVMTANPSAKLFAHPSVEVDFSLIEESRVARILPGDSIEVERINIVALGGTHAPIHPDVPRIENIGYFFVEDAILHPGDEFIVPEERVRVLCAPISGPWQSLEDAVDYVRDVCPEIVVPIHEGMLARPKVYLDYLDRLKPDRTTLLVPVQGVPASV